MTNQVNSNAGDKAKDFFMSRKGVGLRFLYTLIFLGVLGVVGNIIWIISVFQYVFLFITKNYIKPLRKFSSSLTAYIKEIMDYVLLLNNRKPFPFSEFPKSEEPSDIHFDEA